MRIIIDTETTGLDPIFDEILELSVIDADTGEVLHSQRYEPAIRMEWTAAEVINGISPSDVRGCPEIGSDHDIQRLIDQADWIGGWNIEYDLSMLSAVGVMPRPDAEIVDVMEMDVDLCGMITPDHPAGRWRKLAVAAEWWGYQPPEGKMYHSSIVDCLATRHVYNQIRKYHSRKETDRLVYGESRIHMEDIMRDAGIIQQQLLQMMRSGTDHDMMIIDELNHALSAGARYMRAIAHGAQYHDQIDDYKEFQQRVIDALHMP